MTALWLFVALLILYAYRNWFTSLCGLVLLTVLAQHHDMPTGMFGISGLNPWNVVFFFIVTAYVADLKNQACPLPPMFSLLVKACVALLVVGALRALFDFDTLSSRVSEFSSRTSVVFESLLNPLKYILVGVMFYHGCRTAKQSWLGLHTLLLFGLLHALLMYKAMKGMVFVGNYEDARRMTDKMIGLHANDLAGLLTFTLWGIIVYAMVLKGRARVVACMAAIVVLPALVGCHSRGAYAANVGVALILGAVRWHKLLLVFPVGLLAVVLVFPKIIERVTMDVAAQDASGAYSSDWNEITAGRTAHLWEPTLAQIAQSPVLGHGRYAIWRANCFYVIREREGSVPSHPHNSYLEVLLDFGFVGLAIVLGMYGSVMLMGVRMARSGSNVLFTVVGGIGITSVACVGLLGLSSNFVYPKESLLWVMCSVGLTVRMWVTYQQWRRRPVGVAASQGRPVRRLTKRSTIPLRQGAVS